MGKEIIIITTSFDMTVLNDLDLFHMVMDAIDHVPRTGEKCIYLKQQFKEADRAQAAHRQARPRHAGNPALEVEQPQMNAQELMPTTEPNADQPKAFQ